MQSHVGQNHEDVCNRQIKSLLIFKTNSTYSPLLSPEQESLFNIAFEKDERLNMVPTNELILKYLMFICYNDDDFHHDFYMYIDFVGFRQESSPHLNKKTMDIQTKVIHRINAMAADIEDLMVWLQFMNEAMIKSQTIIFNSFDHLLLILEVAMLPTKVCTHAFITTYQKLCTAPCILDQKIERRIYIL